MSENFTWNGNEFRTKLVATSAQNLVLAAATLQRHMRKLLSVSAGGASKRAKGIREDIYTGGNVDAETVQKYRHSEPGEPPRKITGFLQRNVTMRVHPGGDRVDVGLFKNAIYGYYLERGIRNDWGTWRIAPRPWMLEALKQNYAEIARVAAIGRAAE